MANPCIRDSNCISLDVDGGTGELYAEPIIQHGGGLQCNPNGLAVLVNPAACNPMTLTGSGLAVPADHDSTILTGGTGVGLNIAGVQTTGSGININAVPFAAAFGTNATTVSQTASISHTNMTCRRQNILATWATGPTGFQLRNGWWFAVGATNTIVSPHATGGQGPSVQMNTSNGPLAGGTPSAVLGFVFPPSLYALATYLDPGETATISISLFAAAIIIGQGDPGGFAPISGGQNFFGVSLILQAWTT